MKKSGGGRAEADGGGGAEGWGYSCGLGRRARREEGKPLLIKMGVGIGESWEKKEGDTKGGANRAKLRQKGGGFDLEKTPARNTEKPRRQGGGKKSKEEKAEEGKKETHTKNRKTYLRRGEHR